MKRIVILVAALALVLPGAAFAQGSPTCQSYSPQDCTVVSNVSATQTLASTSPTGSTSSTNSSTLPFTGLDVVLLAAGGAMLLGAGLVVRRLSAGPTR